MTLSVTRGDDECLTVLVTDPDNNDAPVDLTGSTLTFMVKRLPTDLDVDALLTMENPATGIVLSNQITDTGEAQINLDAADTEPLPPGIWYWELQGVDSTGEVKTLAYGRIRIVADLVRTS